MGATISPRCKYTYHIDDWNSREWRTAWRQLVKDTPKIIDAAKILLSGRPSEDPTVHVEKGIYINGDGGEAEEPLRIEPGITDWSFETRGKPYDAVVACILLRAQSLAPGQFELREWPKYWGVARGLYLTVWPDEFLNSPLEAGIWRRNGA
ncbi:hypothetical protein HFD88_008260 [Aspergillus terreus]|nr:hypothetical protein HFD88_008260 [Aspergillus terreus]